MSEVDGAIPPLRDLSCTIVNNDDQKMVQIRDGLGVSPDVAVPLPLFMLMRLFNGTRTVLDIQSEIARQSGDIVPGAALENIVEQLDQAYLLDSKRFQDRLQEVRREWDSSPSRPASHGGDAGCYSEDPKELEREMEEMYRLPGAADPSKLTSEQPLRAVLAPHIDFHRGGHTYTWAYHEVRRRGSADLYVILGTCHEFMESPFAITRKSYETPWGPVTTDGHFIDRLEQLYPHDLFQEEIHHRNEHSIEFQVLFLRHALGEKKFKIVPILCQGFGEAIQDGTEPDRDPLVASFLDSLAETIAATRASGQEVVLVGGVDLAHVGQHFGDKDPLTPQFLEEVGQRDQELLSRAAAVDSRGFFEEIARDGDRRKICGFGPIYTILALLERGGGAGQLKGGLLSYDQAVDMDHDLCVSFASMAFEDR